MSGRYGGIQSGLHQIWSLSSFRFKKTCVYGRAADVCAITLALLTQSNRAKYVFYYYYYYFLRQLWTVMRDGLLYFNIIRLCS